MRGSSMPPVLTRSPSWSPGTETTLNRSIRSHLSLVETHGKGIDIREKLLLVSPSPGPVYAHDLETTHRRAPRAVIPTEDREKHLVHTTLSPGPVYHTEVRSPARPTV